MPDLLPNPAARRLFLHRHALAEAPTGPATGADLARLIDRSHWQPMAREALRMARAAELFDIEVAPHFLPGVFVHLAADWQL